MIKYLILLLNFIGLLIVNLFISDVAVTINAPDEVVAGTSFTVEITFSKSELKSMGRYKQDLPVGYTATAINSFSGDFTFKDNIVKIVWNPQLPLDSVFTISYKIQVHETAEGPLVLGGDFSYIDDNERKTLTIPNKTIIVRGQGAIANNVNQNPDSSNQIVNNNLTQNFPTNEIYCYRQIVRDVDGIKVHILINTANLSKDKFAKIQEKIPSGYIATNIESKDGIFSSKDNIVKFLWMSLPAENQYQISYKLVSGTPSSEMPEISGSLSYIENEGTKIKTIENRDFIGTNMMANNNNQQNQNNIDTSHTNLTNNQINNQNNQINNNQIVHNQTIVGPEKGINYKVQIGAYRKNLNVSYFKKMQVAEDVAIEINNGLNKYIIGSHGEYKEARDHRVKIWETTPIRDAFVSAYNNGTRITVQEAIMIANQKWYQ